MMKNQVNDMLNDIVNERRKTFGYFEEPNENGIPNALENVYEEDSEDSFDEMYVPHSSRSIPYEEEKLEESDSSNDELLQQQEEGKEEGKEEMKEEGKEEEGKEEMKEEEEVKEEEVKEEVKEEEVKEEEVKEEVKEEEEVKEVPQQEQKENLKFIPVDDCPAEILNDLIATEISMEEPECAMEDIIQVVENEEKKINEKKEKKGGFWCMDCFFELNYRENSIHCCCCYCRYCC